MFKSADHLTNKLIGAVLIWGLLFILVWAIDRGNPQPGGRIVLWSLAIVGLGALVGWMGLAFRRFERSGLADRL